MKSIFDKNRLVAFDEQLEEQQLEAIAGGQVNFNEPTVLGVCARSGKEPDEAGCVIKNNGDIGLVAIPFPQGFPDKFVIRTNGVVEPL